MVEVRHDFHGRTAKDACYGAAVIALVIWLLVICCPVMAVNVPMQMVLPSCLLSNTEETANLEYQLKAAFLYNFMKFIEFPQSSDLDKSGEDEPVVLAVIGEDQFGRHLDDLTKKMIKDRPIRVVRLEGFEQYKKTHARATTEQYLQAQQKEIEGCRLLFVSRSEEGWSDAILAFTEKMRIITVSDMTDFAPKGGIIGFVMEENKIRFDINMVSAEKKQLKVSSQLLQLARKIYKKQQ